MYVCIYVYWLNNHIIYTYVIYIFIHQHLCRSVFASVYTYYCRPIAHLHHTPRIIPSATCSCANGIASSGAACTSDGAKKCASCNTGFEQSADQTACNGMLESHYAFAITLRSFIKYLLTNAVNLPLCTCTLFAACKVAHVKSYSTGRGCGCSVAICETGWRVSGDRDLCGGGSSCVKNVCSCANGIPASGAYCGDKPGKKKCVRCNPGFKRSSDRTACNGMAW